MGTLKSTMEPELEVTSKYSTGHGEETLKRLCVWCLLLQVLYGQEYQLAQILLLQKLEDSCFKFNQYNLYEE